MKNLNKNPLAWFLIAVTLGWWATESGNAMEFIVFILAVILSKQIEIISHKERLGAQDVSFETNNH
jgi:hypothetical protein